MQIAAVFCIVSTMEHRRAVTRAMEQLLAAAGAPARSEWSGSAQRRLHHLEAGAGEPVVLLHGGTGGGANWFRIMALLTPRFRVLAPDFPGFGLSDPVVPQSPLGDTAADLIARWLDDVGIARAHVTGTSFGGLVALRLAQRQPARVRSLLLLDSAGLGREISPLVRVAATPPLTRLLMQPSRRGTRMLLQRLLTTDTAGLPAAQLDALVAYLHATSRSAGPAYMATTLRQFATPRGQREVLRAHELNAITTPTVVMWGERDRMLPVRHARRAAAQLPHARLEILTGIGHSPNWEAPVPVAAAIRELAS